MVGGTHTGIEDQLLNLMLDREAVVVVNDNQCISWLGVFS